MTEEKKKLIIDLRNRLDNVILKDELGTLALAESIGISYGTLVCFIDNTKPPQHLSYLKIRNFVRNWEEKNLPKEVMDKDVPF
jgi:hypothetical protein